MIFIDNISKSFDDKCVIDGFSETLKDNTVYFVTGKSGVGKTTLARLIMGLESPDKGQIKIKDGSKISAVFQDDALCENMSVYLNLKVVSGASDDDISSYLEKIGLSGYENKRIRELSGGMKRRVAILRAILSEYDFIIMDEPFKGLDAETKQIVMDMVIESIEGKCALIITHDISEIDYFKLNMRCDIKTLNI